MSEDKYHRLDTNSDSVQCGQSEMNIDIEKITTAIAIGTKYAEGDIHPKEICLDCYDIYDVVCIFDEENE